MNILRNPKSRICSIISLDESSEYIENRILELSKETDVYLILNKCFTKKINSNSYCHLLPIMGYEIDNSTKSNRTYPLINVLKYLIEITKYYSIFHIDVDSSFDPLNIRKMHTSELGASVMDSYLISHEFREDLYINTSSWFYKIFRKQITSGIHITHESGDMLLTLTDIIDYLKLISSTKEYVDTFNDVEICYSIPSMFEKFEINYMKSNVNKIKI